MKVEDTFEWLESDDQASLQAAMASAPELISARSELGDTLLHEACRQKKAWAVEVLLDGGADPNLPGDLGFTALHCAVRDCTADEAAPLVSLLISHGADPSALDVTGADVFHHVVDRHEIWDDPARIVALLRP